MLWTAGGFCWEECVSLVGVEADKAIRHGISVVLDGMLRSRMVQYSLWTGVSDLICGTSTCKRSS